MLRIYTRNQFIERHFDELGERAQRETSSGFRDSPIAFRFTRYGDSFLRRVFRLPLLILSFFFVQSLSAQVALVKATADKDTVLLGEPFWLTLEIRAPHGSTIEPFKVDSIPHLEFLKKDSVTRTEEGGATLIRQYFQLISFDSGQWVIPPFQLREFVRTNSLLVNVVFTDPFDPTQPYHDIQDVRSVPINKSKLLLWLALGLAMILLLALIIYFATQKKLKFFSQAKDPPYEGAKKRLKALKQEQPQEKVFYETLIGIFRNYVRQRTGIESLQQTSNDLSEKLKPLFVENSSKYTSLNQVLVLSDFVKFAKYDPADSEATSAYEVIEQSIDHIEEEVKRNQARAVLNKGDKIKTSSSGGGGGEVAK